MLVAGWWVVAGTAAMVTRTRASAAAPLIHRGTEGRLLGLGGDNLCSSEAWEHEEHAFRGKKLLVFFFSVLTLIPHKL